MDNEEKGTQDESAVFDADQMIQQKFDDWQLDIGLDLTNGMTYSQFRQFLHTVMGQTFDEESQFQEVCNGLDPDKTGFVHIKNFIAMVTALEDELQMEEMQDEMDREQSMSLAPDLKDPDISP